MIQQDPEEIEKGIKRFSQEWLDNRVKHLSEDLVEKILPLLIQSVMDNEPEKFMAILKSAIGGAFRSGTVGTCLFVLEMGEDITPIKETDEYKAALKLANNPPYNDEEEEQSLAD